MNIVMKTFVRIVLSILIMISSIAFPFPIIKVKAADYTATVNFSTTSPRTIELGMAGFHRKLAISDQAIFWPGQPNNCCLSM